MSRHLPSWGIYYIILILTRRLIVLASIFSKLLGEGEEVGCRWPPGPRRPNWIVLQTFGAECDCCDVMWKQFVNWRYIILYLFRIPFSTIQNCGPTGRTINPLQERPCLIIKKQNYPRTGAHHSLRSASLWRSAIKLIRSSSTNKPTPYTPWSLTETTVRRHWVVTPGRSWLANRHRCRDIVTGKGSIVSGSEALTIWE